MNQLMNYLADAMDDPDGYFEHHGIKGQKWGQRNGPPYPLDGSDHSATERKEVTGETANQVEKKKTNIRQVAKSAIGLTRTGAGILATAATIAGAPAVAAVASTIVTAAMIASYGTMIADIASAVSTTKMSEIKQ